MEDPYESKVVRIAAQLVFWALGAALLAFLVWVASAGIGFWGGLGTVLTGALWIFFAYLRRRHKNGR